MSDLCRAHINSILINCSKFMSIKSIQILRNVFDNILVRNPNSTPWSIQSGFNGISPAPVFINIMTPDGIISSTAYEEFFWGIFVALIDQKRFYLMLGSYKVKMSDLIFWQNTIDKSTAKIFTVSDQKFYYRSDDFIKGYNEAILMLDIRNNIIVE